MKIAICNYRYFISGGPERYLFSVTDLLNNNGYEVIPFSVGYAQNKPTEYSKYFLKPIGNNGSEAYLNDLKSDNISKIKLFFRSVYSLQAKKSFKKLIQDQKIDLAYMLQINNYISPSIIDTCRSNNVPVVWRLSDYQLLCPSYHLIRNGKPCELCIKGNLFNAIKGKCLHDSTVTSAGKALSMYIHRLIKIYDKVDAFITPSLFLKDKLISAGFSENKIHNINSFFDTSKVEPSYDSNGYLLYIGRISKEKGIETLLKALKDLPDQRVIFAGGYSKEEFDWAHSIIKENRLEDTKIVFTGHQDDKKLFELIKGANFVVVPSICYENYPQVIMEANACGKPVIASDIGSIKEQIIDGDTGLLFKPGDPNSLAGKMIMLVNDKKKIIDMGKAARSFVQEKNDPKLHFEKLNSVFLELKNKKTID